MAEDRLLTPSGGVGGTKVRAEGRGSVVSVAKITVDRNSPDILPPALKPAGSTMFSESEGLRQFKELDVVHRIVLLIQRP